MVFVENRDNRLSESAVPPEICRDAELSMKGEDLAGGVNADWFGRDADGDETGREVGVAKTESP